MRKLVFIHGRAQENKDSIALKKEWVDSFRTGLSRSSLEFPILETDVRFPYYGQMLFDLRQGLSPQEAAAVVVRGDASNEREEEFMREVLAETLGKALELAVAHGELSADELPSVAGSDVIQKGFLNWGWVQKSLEWIDSNVPGASGASIALATKDVHDYLRNPGLRDMIESGIREALNPGEETVVVAHSLGSVVAYNLLRREGQAQGWVVPVFITLGAPLGVSAIRRSLAPLTYPPVVSQWFNAMDSDDVVALYPLKDPWFAVQGIENYTEVDNQTSNQHGIAGYMADPEVARRIHAALA